MGLRPNALTKKLTGMHKDIPEIRPSIYYENLLTHLRQKKYSRKGFSFAKPQKSEVKALLEEEAKILFESEANERDKKVADYVSTHLDKAFNDRQKQWLRLADFFEKLEDYNEVKQNQAFLEAYLEEKSKLEKHISGEDDFVMSEIDTLFSNMKLPYDLKVAVDYTNRNRCVVLDVELPFDFGIPTIKEVYLVRSGATYKDKLQREITQETTDSILSLVYYLAGLMFSVSVNICYVQVAVWKTGHTEGQLWVEFERDRFSAIDINRLAPDADIYNWTHVMNEKMVRGAMRLEPIRSTTFTTSIKNLEDGGVTHSNFIRPPKPMQKPTTCILTMDDAIMIRDNIADNQEIADAIELADSQGKQSIVLPVKYDKILSELKKTN
jgi:hypothetical protein